MTKLLKVVEVETREETTETVIKSKRHDYVRGGFKLEETIFRVKTAAIFAILECGHERRQYSGGPMVVKATRLSCYVCDTAAWQLEREKKKSSEALEQTT